LYVTGPAPDAVTNEIFEITKKITHYSIVNELSVAIDKLGTQKFYVSFWLME